MAERLVILSDMWGSKKGLWITSYLGYLQQYFDIVYYDIQQLADVDPNSLASDHKCLEFLKQGLDTAVNQLLKKESIPSHYLTFCSGGTIAWQASLKGLPVKSLYAVSARNLNLFNEKPDYPIKLVFGENQWDIPSEEWRGKMNISFDIVKNFGNELYTDEVIIQKVCLSLLESAIKKQFQY